MTGSLAQSAQRKTGIPQSWGMPVRIFFSCVFRFYNAVLCGLSSAFAFQMKPAGWREIVQDKKRRCKSVRRLPHKISLRRRTCADAATPIEHGGGEPTCDWKGGIGGKPQSKTCPPQLWFPFERLSTSSAISILHVYEWIFRLP